MTVQYKAELKNIERGEARVHVEIELEDVYKPLLAPVFEAILRGMRDTDKKALYGAMTNFFDEEIRRTRD